MLIGQPIILFGGVGFLVVISST